MLSYETENLLGRDIVSSSGPQSFKRSLSIHVQCKSVLKTLPSFQSSEAALPMLKGTVLHATKLGLQHTAVKISSLLTINDRAAHSVSMNEDFISTLADNLRLAARNSIEDQSPNKYIFK